MVRTHHGYSLVELIVTLAILSTVLTLSIPQLISLKRLQTKLQQKVTATYTLEAIAEHLRRGYVASSQFPYIETTHIHQPGELRSLSGELHSVSMRTSTTRPHPFSQAVTFVIVRPYPLFRAIKLSGNELLLCEEGVPLPDPYDITDTNHWLLVNPQQAIHKTGDVKKLRIPDSRCGNSPSYRGEFNETTTPFFLPEQSISFSTTSMSTPRVAFPIEDSYSLYVSADNTLRRVSHITSEMQPILRGVIELTVVRTHHNKLQLAIDSWSATTESNRNASFTYATKKLPALSLLHHIL